MATATTVRERQVRRLSQKLKAGVRDHKRHFRIEMSSRTPTLAELRAAQDPTTGLKVPQFLDLYPSDLACICQDIEFEQLEDGPYFFDGIFTYSSETSVEQEQQQEENPLNRPAVVKYGHDRYSRIVWLDKDGNAILNSAKEPFDPPIEIESGRPVITITKNFATFSGALAETYQDAINSDSFLGYPQYTVKVMGIEASLIFAVPSSYWEVNFVFAVQRETWRLKVLDRGYNELYSSGLSAITDDKDGMPVQTPQRLDGSGIAVPPGVASSYFHSFKVYRELPFSALGVP